MAKTVSVSFPGGQRLAARIDQHTVFTDQPRDEGGEGTAPSPFDLFLASIATCSAYYAQGFAEAREIDTSGMALTLHCEYDEEAKRYPRLEMVLTLPPDFPKKYENAVLKAMEACFVKKHIVSPPEFVLRAERS